MTPGTTWLHDLGRDLRFAFRSLWRTPAFSVVAIASLGLGLALVAATLAVTNAYLIRDLPYPGGKHLYHVRYAPPGPFEPRGMSALDWKSVSDVVEAPITSAGDTFYVSGDGFTQIASAIRVSAGFLEGLSVQPALGRTFAAEDFKPGAAPVALIGHALWRDRFNSDPGIVGRDVRITPENQNTGAALLRIVGVLPAGTWFGRTSNARVDFLVPLQVQARTYMVRLRPGVPPSLAEHRLTEAARVVGSDIPPNWTGVQLESVHGRYVQELRPLLVGITLAAGLVLLLVSTNVAVLVLLRALRRQKEIAVRVALGAERHHLLRMLATEAVLVCAAALALGLVATNFTLRALAPVIESQLGRPPPAGTTAIAVDPTVVATLGGVGLLVTLALALVPLLAPRQRQLADMLRRAGLAATDGPGMRRLRSTLIALEVAGALVLLVGGGLMVRSVVNLVRTDFGFDAEHVARARVVLPGRTYATPAALAQFYARLGERLTSSYAAVTVSSSFPPFYETFKQTLESDASRGGKISVGVLPAGAGHFEVNGIPVRQGREFLPTDRLGAEPVAIVSETLARQLWPDGGAVGHRIRVGEGSNPGSPAVDWRTVVGVVRDVRQTYTDRDTRDVYLPFLQVPTRFGTVQVRTDRPGAFQLAKLPALVAEMDPFVQVNEPRLLASENTEFARTRFLSAFLGGFAAFATALALLGIYGVTAYAVQQREREVAIRIAIGATRPAVVRLFLRKGGIVVALGILLGLAAAAGASRVLENQIHGVESLDFPTLAAACAVMAGTGLLATWWPVRRAARGDVVTILKAE